MNRRTLLTALIGLSLLTLPKIVHSEVRYGLIFKTTSVINPFFSVTEIQKNVLQTVTIRPGITATCCIQDYYDYYEHKHTTKVMSFVTINKRTTALLDTTDLLEKIQAGEKDKVEFTPEEIEDFKAFITHVNTVKADSFLVGREEIGQYKKYFEPEVFKIVTPDINGSADYYKQYTVNIPSEIQGMMSQVDYLPTINGWKVKLTSSAEQIGFRPFPGSSAAYSSIFKGTEENMKTLLLNNPGYKEYIFIQRVRKVFASIRD